MRDDIGLAVQLKWGGPFVIDAYLKNQCSGVEGIVRAGLVLVSEQARHLLTAASTQ